MQIEGNWDTPGWNRTEYDDSESGFVEEGTDWTLIVLGATVGTFFGAVLLFGILLLCQCFSTPKKIVLVNATELEHAPAKIVFGNKTSQSKQTRSAQPPSERITLNTPQAPNEHPVLPNETIVVRSIQLPEQTIQLPPPRADRNIAYLELNFAKKLGTGTYGEVWLAHWRGMEVAEYVERGTLEEIFKRSPHSIPLHEKWELVKDISFGMRHLSSQGIVHKDLAARNVLVTVDGKAKVTDFGIARDYNQDHPGKVFTGSLKSLAPECLQLRQYTEKSDVWAFGILLVEVYTEQDPFPNLTSFEVATFIMHNQLSAIPPEDCPNEWKYLAKWSTHFKPERRPSFSDIVGYLSTATL